MKEYPVGIHTNVWNAIRYAVITLAMVPFAEKIWALVHAKRTGQRLVHGREARLRQSNLAHWGLHQEVDEKSRLSRISAIAVCVLHIAGAMLLEYGSGSTGSYIFQDSMLSQTLRDDGVLRANGTYFIDTSYVYSQLHGPADCIDGGPRKLSDFGLSMVEKPAFTINSSDQIPRPNISTDLIRWYSVANSGWRFGVYKSGSSRWYAYKRRWWEGGAPDAYLGFTDETVSCSWINKIAFSCSKFKDVGHRNLLSASLATAALPGLLVTRDYSLTQSSELRLNLSRVFAGGMDERGPIEAKAETAWIRGGLPHKRMPESIARDLYLNISGLHSGCNHRQAVYISSEGKLSGLRVSNVKFSSELQVWFPDQEDHKLVLHAYGNYAAVGTLMQARNGCCCSASNFRFCITSLTSAKHELTFHVFERYETTTLRSILYRKRFSCSVEGALRKSDVINIASQSLVLAARQHPVSSGFLLSETLERIVQLIESGRVYSGLVRVLGTQVKGKSVSRSSDIATINILGMIGFAVLTLLVALPVPMLFHYGKDITFDVESSFRGAVMEINGIDSFGKAPDIVPTIAVRDDGDGTLKRTFTT